MKISNHNKELLLLSGIFIGMIIALFMIISIANDKLAQSNKNNLTLISLNEKLQTKIKTLERNNAAARKHGKEDYILALTKMERKYNIPSGILQNIAYHESRYNPNAVSHKGAIGIMQSHPKWHKSVNPFNPYDSIKYGAKYLSSLYKQFSNWEVALAAWNWGPGNIAKKTFYNAPKETRQFIKNVMQGISI